VSLEPQGPGGGPSAGLTAEEACGTSAGFSPVPWLMVVGGQQVSQEARPVSALTRCDDTEWQEGRPFVLSPGSEDV
jgi:hypothetical protein